MVLDPNRLNTRISGTTDVRTPVIADIDGLGVVYSQSFQRCQKDVTVRFCRKIPFAGNNYYLKIFCKMWNFYQAVFMGARLSLCVSNDSQLVLPGKALQYAQRFGKQM